MLYIGLNRFLKMLADSFLRRSESEGVQRFTGRVTSTHQTAERAGKASTAVPFTA